MPMLSFRNILGFSRNQHSLKAEAEKMAKEIVCDLIQKHIDDVLTSCSRRLRDYGPDSMPLTFFEQDIYKKCKDQPNGIDTSEMAVLEKILGIEILNKLPSNFQFAQRIEFKNILTKFLQEEVSHNVITPSHGLYLKIRPATVLSSAKIVGYFGAKPDPELIVNCIKSAIEKVMNPDSSLIITTPRDRTGSQDLTTAEGILLITDSASAATLTVVGTSEVSSYAVSTSLISGGTGIAKEGSDCLSDDSLILRDEPINKSSVKPGETPPKDPTPPISRFN